MLISHRKQFIFTKTFKTAGTSVESYFEQYCMPDGEWQQTHTRDEYQSADGIIGYRGPNPAGSVWYNHMSAKGIRDLIGQDISDRYFKFTVIRNPFDKLISWFLFNKKIKQKQSTSQPKNFAEQLLEKIKLSDQLKNAVEIEQFRNWVRNGNAIIDRDRYLIDGNEYVDYFIRFESLYEGINYVCEHLSIPFEPSRLPEFKKGTRDSKIPVWKYYDRRTESIVRRTYAWEIERFGYDCPKQDHS
jgi:hypothetical protein